MFIPSEHTKLMLIPPRTGDYYEISPGGFLDGFEIRFTKPVNNLNAGSSVIGFLFEHKTGAWEETQVFARFRPAIEG